MLTFTQFLESVQQQSSLWEGFKKAKNKWNFLSTFIERIPSNTSKIELCVFAVNQMYDLTDEERKCIKNPCQVSDKDSPINKLYNMTAFRKNTQTVNNNAIMCLSGVIRRIGIQTHMAKEIFDKLQSLIV